jgi:hypothetical protein
MGEIVVLPRRDQPADLDTLGQVAALAVRAVGLARLSQHGPDDELQITLNNEKRWVSRVDMMAIAHDMLDQRQKLLDAMASQAAAALVERIVRAIGTMQEAEAIYARSCKAERTV